MLYFDSGLKLSTRLRVLLAEVVFFGRGLSVRNFFICGSLREVEVFLESSSDLGLFQVVSSIDFNKLVGSSSVFYLFKVFFEIF